MKGTLIILLMAIALLCYSSMVMADGLALYGDYSVMGMAASPRMPTVFTWAVSTPSVMQLSV